MRFDVITIFPHIFDSYFNASIIGRAVKKKIIEIKVHDLRKWAKGRHKTVDDRPYGGGPGMIMKADVIYQALKAIRGKKSSGTKARKDQKIVLLASSGKQFNQKTAQRYSRLKRVIFICGRYEGIDSRVEKFVDEKISIGSYVLTGGELPVMVMVDAIARLIPGTIKKESLKEETFSLNIQKEYPQYTRPETLIIKKASGKQGKMKVPKVLLSGDHKKIWEWKLKHATME